MSVISCAPLHISAGATFSKVFRWGQPVRVYKPITGATKAAPCVLTVVGHGLPAGWPFWVESVQGMIQINRPQWLEDRVLGPSYRAVTPSSDTLELNEVNALDFAAYKVSGTVIYQLPVDLTGFTARAQIRESIDDVDPALSLTTENGGIVLDNTLKTITLLITSAQTTALAITSGVYSLELVDSAGAVTRLAEGAVKVSPDVTRV